MHVVVVGAGVIGATTALWLSREGHTVDVLDANNAAAEGASFANAGLISPGHCFSWGEPGIPSLVARSMVGLSNEMKVFPPRSASMLRWGMLFARECNWESWKRNSANALALSAYSRDALHAQVDVRLEDFGGRHGGILYLYGAGDEPGPHDAALLTHAGEPFQHLNAAQILDAEPTLRGAPLTFDHATFSPNDATGDAARFTRAALRRAIELGASVKFGQTVRSLLRDSDKITGVETGAGRIDADAVVLAGGLGSRPLLRTVGASLPLHPVSGYSATYRVRAADLPRMGAVSIRHKIAWASFGEDMLRFTGFADVGYPSSERAKARFQELEAFAASVYPMLGGIEPQRWVGQRPMTPDNLPYIGAGPLSNLWLSCGHGAMGWTMACGSAQIITDLVQGRLPALNMVPYRWDRFGTFCQRAPHS